MDAKTKTLFDHLWITERDKQNEAYYAMIAMTDEPVDWAYEVWDETLANLTHADNHNRAIAAQLLSGLAKSDPEKRMLKDFPALFAVAKDERFVTARHTLQSLWKVGVVSLAYRELLVEALAARFADCVDHKNYTLIRSDILEALRKVFDVTGDETVRTTALALIDGVEDEKYRKKYAKMWKNA